MYEKLFQRIILDIEQLHQVLPNYHAHIVEHKGETLLPNWLGLYRVGISNRSDRYLLVTRYLWCLINPDN